MHGISFDTKTKTVGIEYSEWAYFCGLLKENIYTFLRPRENRELLAKVLSTNYHLSDERLSDEIWLIDFTYALEMGDAMFVIDGKEIDSDNLYLNTALATGNDTMKLAATLHGLSSKNAFVRGENRSWMADIIERDNANIFRAGKGWEEAVTMLRESSEETVFVSSEHGGNILWNVYTKWFDNAVQDRNIETKGRTVKDWDTESALVDEWEDLGEDMHWELVEAWSKENSTEKEISPARLNSDSYYGHGMNAGQLIATLAKKTNSPQSE